MRIFTNFLKSFQFASDIRVILLHLVKQTRRFLARQRRRFRRQGIEQNLAFELRIVVIRERKKRLRKAKSVEILETPQALQLRDIAVGDEVHRTIFGMFREVVVVLDHHQHVVALDLLLGVEHVAADTFIITVRPLVRPCDDNRLVPPVAVVAILQFLEELTPFNRLDVRKIHFETGCLADSVFEHAAHQCGIEQNPRLSLLAHHFIHRPIDNFSIGRHRRGIQRRAEIASDGRQLGAVTHQNQPTAPPRTHIIDQIRKQGSTAENRTCGGRIRQHRGLVDDEYSSPLGIQIQREFRFVIGIRTLTIDPLMNGKCLLLSILSQHLCGPSRRGQQYGFDTQFLERPDKRRNQRCLTRSGISVQNENLREIAVSKVFRQLFYDFFLSGSCFETNFTVNLGRNTCAEHVSDFNSAKLTTNIL